VRAPGRVKCGRLTAVIVRAATPADATAFLELVDGLAEYEKLPPPDDAAKQRLVRDAFSDPPRFHLLLAEVDQKVVGYAVWFPTYSTFLALPSLYLEDIFVLPSARGHGAGLALFRACAAEAVRLGCGRMEWNVLDWNKPSIDFYERLGARRLQAWLPYRLEGEALTNVARA
jgi:GNAT superfamily N-acetyltransferase